MSIIANQLRCHPPTHPPITLPIPAIKDRSSEIFTLSLSVIISRYSQKYE